MQGTAVYQGDATPAPCKGGVELPAVSGGTTSTTETVSRIEPGLTWLKWEIAAGNSAGIGPYEPAVVVVPALIGLHSWYAFDFGRVAGVMTTGGKKTCSAADTDTVCDQTERTGSQVPAGTNLVLWFPS